MNPYVFVRLTGEAVKEANPIYSGGGWVLRQLGRHIPGDKGHFLATRSPDQAANIVQGGWDALKGAVKGSLRAGVGGGAVGYGANRRLGQFLKKKGFTGGMDDATPREMDALAKGLATGGAAGGAIGAAGGLAIGGAAALGTGALLGRKVLRDRRTIKSMRGAHKALQRNALVGGGAIGAGGLATGLSLRGNE